jgi:hypothetical protein
MTIKASGRAALILATGIWIGLSGASQAATATDGSTAAATAKHGSHHLRKYAHRRADKLADKSSADKKATEADAAADDSDNAAAIQSSQMPASVANANAQLASPDTPAGNAQAMTDRANNIVQAPTDAQAPAGAPVVAADQLNDVDRSLQQGTAAAAPVTLASAEAPAVTASPPTATASGESSTWDQTSLIGKIFIGFGALLTMASAARMFMA